MLRYVLGLLVCASLMASPVVAGGGGGGAKKDGNIKVVNNFAAGVLVAGGAANESIIVIADAPASLIAKVNGGTAVPKDITAAGGVIIKRGSSATLPVKSGTVSLFGAVVLPGGHVEPVTRDTLAVAKGQTVAVNATAATAVANW